MDTGEFFQNVARRNYFEFFERGDDIRLLWNAVVSMNSVAEYLALPGDTITLLGVHASELHPSDFHFVDPAALAAVPSPAQHLADLHAHSFLL